LGGTLSEIGSLPSARWFAECNFKSSLPSAKKTLGKKKHSGNKLFVKCFFSLGKEALCRAFFLHSAKKVFTECFFVLHSTTQDLQSTF
jgi:hypothetical protein